MLEELEKIPWSKYRHAYGPATDTPKWLAALANPSSNDSENGPLGKLFGSIYHSGTVYEATSYAVPFLIDIASTHDNPNKEGILALLAAIAVGKSYYDVHGNNANRPEAEFKAQLELELTWVEDARNAVLAGFDRLIVLAKDDSPVTALSAAHVLAKFPEKASVVGPILRDLYDKQSSILYKAGCVLLLGQVKDSSEPSISLLTELLDSEFDVLRFASVISISEMQLNPLPPGASEATSDALMIEEDLLSLFEDLPGNIWLLLDEPLLTD